MRDVGPDITAIANHVRSRLIAVSEDRHHPMRLAWLATSAHDGSAQVRTIVIRETKRTPLSVTFFTDRRSPKWQETLRDTRGSLLLFDRIEMEQIRLRGTFRHRSQADCSAHWYQQDTAARQLFSGAKPGIPLDSDHLNNAPKQTGQDNFGIIDLLVTSVDWLSISRTAHSRAIFDITSGTRWQGHFVNP